MNRRTLIAGFAALPAAAILHTAGAQTPAATPGSDGTNLSPIPNAGSFEGIQSAVSRTWGLDIDALLAATPDLRIEEFVGTTVLSALILKFDTADNARAAYDGYATNIGTQLMAMGQGGTPTVSEEPVSDLGDIASASTLNTVSGTIETFFRFVLVQDETYFFLTSALASDADAVTDADDLARYMTEEGSEQGDEAIFVAEGGSTGGLWGFMPANDSDLLTNLVPIMDETLYPVP